MNESTIPFKIEYIRNNIFAPPVLRRFVIAVIIITRAISTIAITKKITIFERIIPAIGVTKATYAEIPDTNNPINIHRYTF